MRVRAAGFIVPALSFLQLGMLVVVHYVTRRVCRKAGRVAGAENKPWLDFSGMR
jgi:hypothetical protein